MLRVHRHLKYIPALLLAAISLFVFFSLMTMEMEFDESYNLQVPLNLYLNGRYQTWYNGFRMFNPEITTGPTVLLPAYFLFALFSSTSYVLARLVVYAFFAVLLSFFYREFFIRGKDKTATFFGAVFFVVFFSVPYVGIAPTRVLGEVPGVALVVFAYHFFDSRAPYRRMLSGVCLSLAVLTKLIFAIAVVPMLAAAALDMTGRGKLKSGLKDGLARAGLVAAGAALPAAFWNAYKLYALGTKGYLEHIESFLVFVFSKMASHKAPKLNLATHDVGVRIARMLEHMNMGTAGGALMLSLVVLAMLVFAAALIKNREGFNRVYLMIFMYGLTHIGWWTLMNRYDWYRHLFPGLLVFMAGLTLVMYDTARKAPSRKTAAMALTALIAVTFAGHNHELFRDMATRGFSLAPTHEYTYQRHFAKKVMGLAREGHRFYGYGWWQSPQISFLSKTPFYSVYDPAYNSMMAAAPGLLVVETKRWGKLPNHEARLVHNCCFDLTAMSHPDLENVRPYMLVPIKKPPYDWGF